MDRLRAALSAVVITLTAVLVATACAPDSTYLSTTSQGMYFKIPHGWHTYAQSTLKRDGLISSSLPYLVAFDADPKPDVKHLLGSSTRPWGLAEVDGISQADQLGFSLDSLLNKVLPIDQIQQGSGDSVSPLSPSRVITRGNLRGIQASLRLSVTGQAPLSVEQISLVNTPTTKTWVLLMGCSPACFAQQHGQIDRVVNSWIVKAGHK
jgi:hypothetical protein